MLTSTTSDLAGRCHHVVRQQGRSDFVSGDDEWILTKMQITDSIVVRMLQLHLKQPAPCLGHSSRPWNKTRSKVTWSFSIVSATYCKPSTRRNRSCRAVILLVSCASILNFESGTNIYRYESSLRDVSQFVSRSFMEEDSVLNSRLIFVVNETSQSE